MSKKSSFYSAFELLRARIITDFSRLETSTAFLTKNHRNSALTLLLIFSFALGVRFLYWQDSQAELSDKKTVLQGMAYFYEGEARRILEDGGKLFPNQRTESQLTWMIIHPPGYAILMALFSDANQEPASQSIDPAQRLRILQIFCGALSAVLIFLIANQLLPNVVALLNGLLVAFSPHFSYYCLATSPDTLSVLPILVAVYLIVKARQHPHLLPVILAGTMIGLSCWLRSNGLLLAFFLAFLCFILFPRKQGWRYGMVLILATIIVIAPITIRNWVVYEKFIPISIGAGITLIEGIADYDHEQRFGMPANDTDAALKDAAWHGRPDYADSPWDPDGVMRDHYRFAAGLKIIRSNPLWFFNTMVRRTGCMVRYNDFREPDGAFCITTAPFVAETPGFASHHTTLTNFAPVLTISPDEFAAQGERFASEINIETNNEFIQIAGKGAESDDQFVSAPFIVQPFRDYVLALPVDLDSGDINIKITSTDLRQTLAIFSPPKSRKKKREKKGAASDDEQADENRLSKITFASADSGGARIVISNKGDIPPVVRLGQIEVFDVGKTPNQWTRFPRSLIRLIQKNLYKTDWMRILLGLGLLLMLLAGQYRKMVILLLVPAYYLSVQSALHTEYRYILVIHYFLFTFVAVAICYFGSWLMQLFYRPKSDHSARLAT